MANVGINQNDSPSRNVTNIVFITLPTLKSLRLEGILKTQSSPQFPLLNLCYSFVAPFVHINSPDVSGVL